MKNQLILASLATAALVTCSAFTSADDKTNVDGTGKISAHLVDQNNPSAESAKSLMSRGDMSEKDFDAHFVMEAAEDNMTEIQIAKTAERKTQDSQVKEFAAMLVRDHEDSDRKLKAIAEKKGINWPAQLNEVGQAKVTACAKKSGPDFDRHFVYGMVGEHVKDVLWYRASAQLLQDPDLKQFAEQSLPTLREHLQHAEQLAGAGDAVPAGAHIHGSGSDQATPSPTGTSGSSTDSNRTSTGTGTSGTNR